MPADRPSTTANAILAVLLGAQAMAIIDLSIVNVAAPTIKRDLDASGAGLQLVVSGYVITYAISLITCARLGDRIGYARMFRAGLVLFTLASLACGLAADQVQLIAFRLIQGLGAGMMIPQVISLIQRTFSGPARARALGFYATTVSVSAVVGQVAGGALVSAGLFGSGWRPIFLINVIIGALLAVPAWRALPAGGAEQPPELDPAGVAVSAAALVTLVVPLILGHEEGWPLWCFLSLAASVVLFALFAAVEARVGRRGGRPLVSGTILRAPGLVPGASTLFLGMAANSGFLFAFALYLQGSLGLSALQTGLIFSATAVGVTISSLFGHRLPARLQRLGVPGGMAGCAVGWGLAATIESGGSLRTVLIVADLFLLGLFFGLAYSPVITLALGKVPVAMAADASGVLVTMLQLGQIIGVASLGTLYLSRAGSSTVDAVVLALAAAAAIAAIATFTGAALVRKPPEPEGSRA